MDEKSRLDKREYYRKWRAEHPEQVRAAQMRFWVRQALIEKRDNAMMEEVKADGSHRNQDPVQR